VGGAVEVELPFPPQPLTVIDATANSMEIPNLILLLISFGPFTMNWVPDGCNRR
jgi:hypothetical protein